MNLSKKFNAESCLSNLNTAIEKQFTALRSTDLGAARTFASVTKDGIKVRLATRDLAKALNVSSKGKGASALVSELAAAAEAKAVPGAERLKQLQDWGKSLWAQEEAKAAEKGLNVLSSVKKLKTLAQKMPKP